MTDLEDPVVILAGLVAAGIAAQWASDRLRIPSILFLLLIGFLAGPALGWIDPDALFGDLLISGVSLGVAIILFEGALSLRFSDIKGAEIVVLRLITLGVAVTIAVIAAATKFALDVSWPMAILVGAIASVSGPTVVIPLLRAVRPNQRVARILHWEGILIDPIGAVLAVITFEAIVAGAGEAEPLLALLELLAIGGVIGSAAGFALGILLRKHLIPDFLRNVTTLALVLFTFALANLLGSEAGLIAVTAMGLTLANIPGTPKDDIIDFKESLSVLLISVLFIVLAARIDVEALSHLGPPLAVLLGAVLFVARPLTVAASTLGSDVPWRERALMAWMAPRGIVAAAVAALFALRLEVEGIPGAELLVPLAFSIIVATVVLHSLTARPLARLLDVVEPEACGVLIIGGNRFARTIALRLKEAGVKVLLADTSYEQVREARMAGIPTFFGNAVSEYADRKLDLVGLGLLLALSRQPALNALACMRYRHEFGSADVFTVRREQSVLDRELETVSFNFRGRHLFKEGMTLERLEKELQDDKTIRLTSITEKFDFDALLEQTGNTTPMLLAIDPEGGVHPFSDEATFRVGPDWRVAHLAKEEEEEEGKSDSD